MSARIDLIPSPFDRLDPLARAIRWWTTQMADIIGAPLRRPVPAHEFGDKKRRSPPHPAIVLSEADAFVARLTLPKGSASAHESAILLRLRDLVPTDPKHLQIGATAIEQAEDASVTYAVAMARRGRLAELENKARKKGARTVRFQAEGLPEIELKSGSAERRQRRSLLIDGAIIAAMLCAAVTAANVWTARIEAGTLALADRERVLRRTAVASETARREGELARDFIDRGVLDRRAGAVLETLAVLNAATPDGAWWRSVRWSPEEITIAAQGHDAAKSIEAISEGAKSWTVELNGAINAGAPQSFELKLRPRKAVAQ